MAVDESEHSDRKCEPGEPIGKVVTELQIEFPDVTHSSLRFLERKGLIASTRTIGGHRVYTRDDVERVRQIKLWQQQQLSLREIRQRLQMRDVLPAAEGLTQKFLQLATIGDIPGAEQIIIDAAIAGVPVQQLFGNLLSPAFEELGRRWEGGRLLVAQEKELTEVARDLISALTIRHDQTRQPRFQLVAACVEGEHHDLGLRMICGLMRVRGYAIHYLGTDVAAEFIRDAVALHRPIGVLLSAKLDGRIEAVRRTIELIVTNQNDWPETPVLLGGAIAESISELIHSLGAVPVADRPLAETLDAIVGSLPEHARIDGRSSFEPVLARGASPGIGV